MLGEKHAGADEKLRVMVPREDVEVDEIAARRTARAATEAKAVDIPPSYVRRLKGRLE